jgi:hypothetical protein
VLASRPSSPSLHTHHRPSTREDRQVEILTRTSLKITTTSTSTSPSTSTSTSASTSACTTPPLPLRQENNVVLHRPSSLWVTIKCTTHREPPAYRIQSRAVPTASYLPVPNSPKPNTPSDLSRTGLYHHYYSLPLTTIPVPRPRFRRIIPFTYGVIPTATTQTAPPFQLGQSHLSICWCAHLCPRKNPQPRHPVIQSPSHHHLGHLTSSRCLLLVKRHPAPFSTHTHTHPHPHTHPLPYLTANSTAGVLVPRLPWPRLRLRPGSICGLARHGTRFF